MRPVDYRIIHVQQDISADQMPVRKCDEQEVSAICDIAICDIVDRYVRLMHNNL